MALEIPVSHLKPPELIRSLLSFVKINIKGFEGIYVSEIISSNIIQSPARSN